jgi:class 3 adenylate cyclase
VDDVRYVACETHHLAYRVREGTAGRDVVLITPGGTIPMDFLERDRIGARLLAGLVNIGRLVTFDRRGIGLSDPITDWSRPVVEQWADDLATIVDAACDAPPAVISLGDHWGPARLFAGRHPDMLAALVLYEPTGPDGVPALTHFVADHLAGTIGLAPGSHLVTRVCPSRADDRAFQEWFDVAGRTGASPGIAARIYDRPPDDCLERLAAAQLRISVPTLVLRRPGNLVGSAPRPDPIATRIPLGQRVDLAGTDFHWLGEGVDELLFEISRFVTGEGHVPLPQRELCAVLFTDLVGSTDRASAVGDTRWKSVLDQHDMAIAEEVTRNGGTVIKTTGDGVLALLPSADRSLQAAEAIVDRLRRDNLEVRVGIHVGDVERRGNDVAGIAVHIAARVMARAGPGEVLVTASVPIAATGSSHEFEPVDDAELKGIPGTWVLFRHTK